MNEFLSSISKILERDLNKLVEEINLYTSEELVWNIKGDIKNSGGNLCLHLCGNLQHFIGATLGNSGYIRNRDNEFTAKGVSRDKLIIEIQSTKKSIQTTLSNLDKSILEKEYPIEVFGYPMTTMFFLIHLTSHLEYHLGQINYHRRLLN
jgi:hypothetical protein